VLYSFTGGADGAQPFAGLLFDTAEKNLYGTTRFGGDTTDCLSFGGCGTVFSLTQNSDGSWTEHVLHRFHHSTKDGKNPFGGLIFDTAGNLYGMTPNGGAHGGGTVFELKPGANGTWAASVLYSFCSLKSCADGFIPVGSLTFDGTGNLYGATAGGGGSCSAGCGVVFQLKPNADGSWTESVLHRFAHNPDATPDAGLIFDSAGNLYGTTIFGGVCSDDGAGCGTVFKLAPLSGGGWTHSVLHVFNGNPAMYPVANVFLDKAGNLYGTTEECGRGYNCFGVVFEITP
jgi:uncharacterized repeat protein (TIGR03803 family)